MRPHRIVFELLYEARTARQFSRAELADLCNEMPGAPDGISAEFIRDLEDRLTKVPVKDARFWFVVEGLGVERQKVQGILGRNP